MDLILLDAAQIGRLDALSAHGASPVVLVVPPGRMNAIKPLIPSLERSGLVRVGGVVERPFDATWLVAAVEEALAVWRTPEPEAAFSGRIGAVPIEQLLQFASTLGKTACLALDHPEGARVELYFAGAELCFARRYPAGPETSLEPIVFEVLSWKTGRFSIVANAALPFEAETSAVRVPITQILLEGLRRMDEASRGSGVADQEPDREREHQHHRRQRRRAARRSLDVVL
jgi:hypothetical protein